MTMCGNYLSPPSTLGVKLRSSSLATCILFIHQASSWPVWLFYMRSGSWTQVDELARQALSLTEPPRRPEYCWQLSEEYVRRCQCCNMTGSPLTSPGLWHSDKRKSDYFFFGHKIVGFGYKNCMYWWECWRAQSGIYNAVFELLPASFVLLLHIHHRGAFAGRFALWERWADKLLLATKG